MNNYVMDRKSMMSMMARSPFFVLGNPRSGTSLFRLMLNSHPEIIVPPECGFAEWLSDEFSGIELDNDVYERFAQAVYSSKKFETWGVGFDNLLSLLKELKPINYRELCFSVYMSYADKVQKLPDLIGDKNNYYINKLHEIEADFPDALKIFIVRDGRDVACSYLELMKKKSSSKYYPDLVSSISSIAKEWSGNAEVALSYKEKGALIIRYEDLISDPSGILTEVCEYLGVQYSELMLEFYNNNDEPQSFLEWKGKTKEPVQPDNQRQYLKLLTSGQIKEFEEIARSMLTEFDYL